MTTNNGTERGWVLGLMSGTSLDGVDAALIETDGERVYAFGPHATLDYSSADRTVLKAAVQDALAWNFTGAEPASFGAAEALLTRAHAQAVAHLLALPDCPRPRLIGFHGQTVLHRPPQAGHFGATRQLGDGAALAKALGLPVAYDFRSADVAAGGQGAPLAPLYHAALLASSPWDSACVVNLGGVANVTLWRRDDPPLAFDCGPANGPVDQWVEAQGRGNYDRDGALSATGAPDEARIKAILSQDFFAATPPKSLDRYAFTAALAEGLNPADGAATLVHLAAAGVARALAFADQRPERLILCGGGRRNPTMRRAIAARTNIPTLVAEECGWRGDAIEAEAFALLAQRVRRGLPLSLPTTTGVPVPLPGGRLAFPPDNANQSSAAPPFA